MHKGLSFAGLAAIVMLAAAPLSLAQTAPTQPTAPTGAQPTPAPTPPTMTPAPTPANPAPAAPAAPRTPAAPATPGMQEEGDASPERTCRTFRQAGEQCSCLSAPTEMGTAEAPSDGGSRNVCVVPQQ